MHDQARILKVMDEVQAIISATDDIDEMLAALLQKILGVLSCDRAWLLYPCDPSASQWWIPIEQTRPEWPGAFSRDLRIPLEEGVRYVFEAALNTAAPVAFDTASPLQVPPEITEQFSVQAQLILAVYPKTDRPWMLGIHHCRDAHIYSDAERQLFAHIGRRLGDSLSTLIALRDLRASEARLERTVQERTAELRRSNRELEQYAYLASHDLQEPLRSVAGFTSLLAQRYRGKLDERADECIVHILEGTKRMQELISALLALSMLGTKGAAFEPTASHAVLAEVIADLSQHLEATGGAVVLGELPVVCADGSQLRQLFQNLISNALKFRSAAPPCIEVSANRRGARWEFRVTDNGIGIAPGDRERVFALFERLHSREAYQGSGIGLAIVKRIVERHGGEIEIVSAAGQGTTFVFTLPGLEDH